MPRKLPWKSNSTTPVASRKRVVTSKSSVPKRQRKEKIDSEDNGNTESLDFDKIGPVSSSSPPPEPPLETFMKEGMDNDDKYRMVEDEFLTVAQRFTMHLHAAEYKRQQSMAKTRNAETISSISRPVVGKMPNHTRRKVEAVARAKSQRAVAEGLLERKSDNSDDSDDSEELPYIGTTLHGLMDSPRRKTVSLANLGTMATSTRAAAGFKKPTTVKTEQNAVHLSPLPKKAAESVLKYENDRPIESYDDYDNLDDPIPIPKLTGFSQQSSKNPPGGKIKSESKTSTSMHSSQAIQFSSSIRTTGPSMINEVASSTKEVELQLPKLDQHRRRRVKPEKKQESTNKFGVIPTFW